MQTLSAFGKSVDWAKSGQFTQQDVDEAKLSVFSAVDSPVAPADKGVVLEVVRSSPSLLWSGDVCACVAGMSRFLSGVTDDMRQQHREKLFAVTPKDLVEAAER